jgi:hypothetical protein
VCKYLFDYFPHWKYSLKGMVMMKLKLIGLVLGAMVATFSAHAVEDVGVNPMSVTGNDVNFSTDLTVSNEIFVSDAVTHEFDLMVNVKDPERTPVVGLTPVVERQMTVMVTNHDSSEVGWRSSYTF